MPVWRPAPHIQVKALGLAWREGLLLASEIYRDDGTIKGVRPLGGRLEFGETWRDALRREFKEELGIAVEVKGSPIVLENIYTHHGEAGHEIVFLSEVVFPKGAYDHDGPITYAEDTGAACIARWFDVRALDCGALELYPSGLKGALDRRE